MLSDIYARELYKQHGCKSLIILKYVSKSKNQNEYSEIYSIKYGIIGKIWSFLISKIPIFIYITRIGRFFCNHNNHKIVLVYFNDRDPITQRLIKEIIYNSGKLVLMEEGLGTYYTSKDTELIGSKICPDEIVVGYPELYKNNHKTWRNIRKFPYSDFFKRENMEIFISGFVDSFNHSSHADIIFLGASTPSSENLRKVECDLLLNIVKKFSEFSVIIKPHPRDRRKHLYNSYLKDIPKISIINDALSKLPIESILCFTKPQIIISLFSSGSITIANTFSHIQVIFCYEVVLTHNKELSGKIEYFTNLLKNIHIPYSYDELYELLRLKEIKNMDDKLFYKNNNSLEIDFLIK